MTALEIEQAAKEQYNAIGDSFFSQTSIMNLIYKAQLQLALKAKVIERTYTTTSVAGQREYSYPTNTIAIKRIEYNGIKLDPIDFRDDDLINTSSADVLVQGTPKWYSIWDFTLYLRPVPDADDVTIKIYSFNQPQAVTASSTLEVPALFHTYIIDYVLGEMAAKDGNLQAAAYYKKSWYEGLKEAIMWQAKRKRGDGFANVKSEDSILTTILGSR